MRRVTVDLLSLNPLHLFVLSGGGALLVDLHRWSHTSKVAIVAQPPSRSPEPFTDPEAKRSPAPVPHGRMVKGCGDQEKGYEKDMQEVESLIVGPPEWVDGEYNDESQKSKRLDRKYQT